jgi:hypothetical protein
MPVQGSRDGEAVFDTDGDGVARPPAQERSGDLAVQSGGHALGAGVVHLECADLEIELGTG